MFDEYEENDSKNESEEGDTTDEKAEDTGNDDEMFDEIDRIATEKLDKRNMTQSVIQKKSFKLEYKSTHEKRWALGKYLIENMSLPVIPLVPFDKKPILRGWNKKTDTTLDELDGWRSQNETYNLGLPVGSTSGIVGIDVDGESGAIFLNELSEGDLPDTVTYLTRNGKRYLYRIPEELRDKFFKKFARNDPNIEHQECALLGDGQQTVLPYSIHPCGVMYEFETGKSFEEIQIAYMPEWMKKIMLREKESLEFSFSDFSDNTKLKPVTLNNGNVQSSNRLEKVCRKCDKLKNLLDIQKNIGLPEEDWFLAISILVRSGYVALAEEFSQLSSKHNARSSKRIGQLSIENKGIVRCTTLGCAEDDIQKCHPDIRYKDSQIINSPKPLICNSQAQKEKLGFRYEKGYFVGVNGNIFADYILANFNLVTKDGAVYYHYTSNYWQQITLHELKKILFNFFDRHEKNKW